jgi:halocarboxylic acid dehydrogenase DehI
MSLNRALEDQQVGADLRRLFADIRTSLDLPFVPTVFRVLAAHPEYLKPAWSDLSHVARSREFHAAARALEEYALSLVLEPGWRFGDQQKALAGQKFSLDDMESLSQLASVFTRSLAQVSLIARLMQRGYGGGQKGRVSEARQASALSRLVTFNIPNERDAGMRVWLLYSDIKKTTGLKHVTSLFRALSPYPGYLAATWVDAKKLLPRPDFLHARDQMARRISSLVVGLPVNDHRSSVRGLTAEQWQNVEELIDSTARFTPQMALIATVWQRSFPQYSHELLPRRDRAG